MTYKISKMDIDTEKTTDYGGGYTKQDLNNVIPKGYVKNDELTNLLYDGVEDTTVYDRKNGKFLYFVTKEN